MILKIQTQKGNWSWINWESQAACRCLVTTMGNACHSWSLVTRLSALSEHVLRPYPNRNLCVQQRMCKYRLTGVRRIAECAFGILANKWRIFQKPFDVTPQFCDSIVTACCILNNFVRWNVGLQLEGILYDSNFESIHAPGISGNTVGRHVSR